MLFGCKKLLLERELKSRFGSARRARVAPKERRPIREKTHKREGP